MATLNTDAKVRKYLNYLATTTATDISGWDLSKLFKGEGKSLLREHEKINQIFLEQKQKFAQQAPAQTQSVSIPRELNRELKAAAQLSKKGAISRINQEIRSVERRQREQEKEINKAILSYQKRIASLKKESDEKLLRFKKQKENIANDSGKRPPSFASQVRKVIAAGWYTGAKVSGTYLWLLTPTIRAGAQDLGRYAVRINIKTLEMNIFPHERNYTSSGYYHMFVGEYGTICWGNASFEVQILREQRDLPKMLTLLASLLTTNGDNGYISMSDIVIDGRDRSIDENCEESERYPS